jgi:hypothetical protein
MLKTWVLIILLIITGCSAPSPVKPEVKINPASDNILSNIFQKKTVLNPDYPKYIVANLATLKLRVYQLPCDTCSGELIFTTDMVVGKDTPTERTKPGYYKIYRWEQFHVDYEKKYLPWYKNPPKPGSTRSQWGAVGAFGWYAALLDPNAGGQWMHGTLGWASEEEKFIEHTMREGGTAIRVKSKGCTRVSNPAISFLRDHVPVGSYLFRIYAKEEIKEDTPVQEVSWSHELKRKNKVLDQGTWTRELKAEAIPVQDKKDKIKGTRPSNPYELNINTLGNFVVDKGQIKSDYRHPKKIKSGGLPKAPDFFIFKEP